MAGIKRIGWEEDMFELEDDVMYRTVFVDLVEGRYPRRDQRFAAAYLIACGYFNLIDEGGVEVFTLTDHGENALKQIRARFPEWLTSEFR